MSAPLLRVNDLKVHFSLRSSNTLFAAKQSLKAVDGISFELNAGETLGIVGESGSGKSTLGRAILQLVAPTSGTVELNGVDITGLSKSAMQPFRRHMQVIFQDPLAALNPRMTVFQIIAEPLTVYEKHLTKLEMKERVAAMMEKVGLDGSLINRYPHEFSGGQCQRIGIARALIAKPQLIICDEPVSALDVSIRAQIINLLMDLQKEMQLALIFIAHDLHVVKHISHNVMVMYLGKTMEYTNSDALYKKPLHPYTQALIRSVPEPDPRRAREHPVTPLAGELPSPLNPPSGCVFRTRCKIVQPHCASKIPLLEDVTQKVIDGNSPLSPDNKSTNEHPHWVACHEV